MNKAVPWNISGVGFDAREAARGAARRQGKSLGEWLHGVIADHAANLGVEAGDIPDQDRIEAVTSKLERLSDRSTELDRRQRRESADSARPRAPRRDVDRDQDEAQPVHHSAYQRDEDDVPPVRRRSHRRDEDDAPPPRRQAYRQAEEEAPPVRRQTYRPDEPSEPRRARRIIEETEFLLEEAIEAMERRAARSQRRTDEALASVATMLEANETKRDRDREAALAQILADNEAKRQRELDALQELSKKLVDTEAKRERERDVVQELSQKLADTEARRERERDAVQELSQKLSDIEGKLTTRTGADEAATPIKGALSRLEARLETIGRRSNAERSARQLAARPLVERHVDNEPIQRLEDKLNSILAAVAARPTDAWQAPPEPPSAPRADADASADRRIGDAIAEISRRQRSLDIETAMPAALRPRAFARDRQDDKLRQDDELRQDEKRRQDEQSKRQENARKEDQAWQVSLAAMQTEIGALAGKIEDMRRDVVQQRAAPAAVIPVKRQSAESVDLDGLRAEIGSMSKMLSDLTPRGSVDQLKGSIDTLTQRIASSRDEGVRDHVLRPVEAVVGDLRQSLPHIDQRPALGLIERAVKAISAKVDRLEGVNTPALSRLRGPMQEIRALLSTAAAAPLAAEEIEQKVAVLTAQMDRVVHDPGAGRDLGTAADGLRASIATPPGTAALDKIEGRLEALTRKIDALPAAQEKLVQDKLNQDKQAQDKTAQGKQADDKQAEIAGLEKLVRELGQKIEAARAPGAETSAIEALQQQVARLAARFESSESGGLSSLANLERSMKALFAHLEQTNAKIETAAAAAAREVVRTTLADSQSLAGGSTDIAALAALQTKADQRTQSTLNAVHQTLEHVVGRISAMETTDIAALTALQTKADQRTQSTLNAVHQTLEHVVGRMSAMEADIAQVRRAPPIERQVASERRGAVDKPAAVEKAAVPEKPVANVKPARPAMPDLTLDSMHEPLFAAKPKMPPATGLGSRPVGEEEGRADFIAAARRAAQSVQNDPSVVAFKQQASKTEARAGLLEKSRDYVATHKRPVLLSVAAVFVVLGTMAIVQRMTFDSGDDRMAALAPAKIARMADASPMDPPAVVAATRNDLTPSALPAGARALSAQIPGSDPIQTGSIQTGSMEAPAMTSLPAFAAEGNGRSGPPQGLLTMAQAGNGAAEYELASRYADGKLVPRDFRLAVEWYAKAAEQGLAPAQYRLAALYEKGLGVQQDKDRAKSLYLQSAQAGNPRAMHNLAVLLADGNGKPDYAGAATWFRKAAQYGVHDSQYNLAILLARGLGVDQSMVQSYQWFAIAAAHDDADAAKKRDEVADKLSANDLALGKALAASFQARTPDAAATDVATPPGGWDSVSAASQINSGQSKISAL